MQIVSVGEGSPKSTNNIGPSIRTRSKVPSHVEKGNKKVIDFFSPQFTKQRENKLEVNAACKLSSSTPRRKNPLTTLLSNASKRNSGNTTPNSMNISAISHTTSKIRRGSRFYKLSYSESVIPSSQTAEENLTETISNGSSLNQKNSFISPIDKLLLKNGSKSPIADKDISPRVILKNIRFNQRSEMTPQLNDSQEKNKNELMFHDKDNEPHNDVENSSREFIQCLYPREEMIENENNNEIVNIFSTKTQNITEQKSELTPLTEMSTNTDFAPVIELVEDLNENQSLIRNDGIIEENSRTFSYNTEILEEAKEKSTSIKSPSTISTDSAKSSSLIYESAWKVTFSIGDLFWGQIYNYCYWPCMVCADPDGKTIGTEKNLYNDDHHEIVHVRFFADNGRRNWVKKENLMPFTNLESYQERAQIIESKFGKKSAKYKLFVPKKYKAKTWHQAIDEANTIKTVPYAQRLEKFYQIYEEARFVQKGNRKRRQSMFVTNQHAFSNIRSTYDSENIRAGQLKRNRSESPFSPLYSPLNSPKRLKLSNEDKYEFEFTDTQADKAIATNRHDETKNSHSSLTLVATNNEYKKFYAVMKDYILGANENSDLERSLINAVSNIWALKQLSISQMQEHLKAASTEGHLGSKLIEDKGAAGSTKRLSNRLKQITYRRSLPMEVPETKESNILPIQDVHVITDRRKREPKRPIEEVVEDIFNLDSKYLFKGLGREAVCKYCCRPAGQLLSCTKNCQSWFHNKCLKQGTENVVAKKSRPKMVKNTTADSDGRSNETYKNLNLIEMNINDRSNMETKTEDIVSAIHITSESEEAICRECALGEKPKCSVCKQGGTLEEKLVYCSVLHCLKYFHPTCCRYWPHAKFTKSKNSIQSFRCPSHVCHTCVSDDPRGKFQHLSNSKLIKCVKCPATYHMDSTCIPAGSEILTASHIICPRHASHTSDVNVNWCFICVKGGEMICCETCPIAVHDTCLNRPVIHDEMYICEECESGRLPLYGEMVWAKFNAFRWWPAIILPPPEVPQNILHKPHKPSDFVVRFFGSHDHGWISRRRVYLYIEGDASTPPKQKSHLDQRYNTGVEEAKHIYEIIKIKKENQRIWNRSKAKLHPQPYIKIRANRAVSPLKLHANIEKVNRCECDPNSESPCGPDSNCLNRVLYHECNPKICPAGDRCKNQMFESRVSPKLEVMYQNERGFGLVCLESIAAGDFIIEYVGEVINDDEFRERVAQKSIDRDENFYFLSVEKDYIIDAGPKGNVSRFMNHSCEPNCETQKWSVNGLNRIGLFAIQDIPENTELTFNYHWDELLGNEKKTCFCGASKCAGQIGGKYKEDKESKLESERNGPSSKNSKVKNSKKATKRKNAVKVKTTSRKSTTSVNKTKEVSNKTKKAIKSNTSEENI